VHKFICVYLHLHFESCICDENEDIIFKSSKKVDLSFRKRVKLKLDILSLNKFNLITIFCLNLLYMRLDFVYYFFTDFIVADIRLH